MVNRHWARGLAVLAVVAALAGCSSSSPTPKSKAQLRKLLLSQATVPAGVKVIDFGGADDGDAQPKSTPTPAASLSCDNLVSVAFFLSDDPHARPVASANISFSSKLPVVDLWMGGEFLFSYRKGGAHQALKDLRSLVVRCPTYDSGGTPTSYSLGHDPARGDEGVHVRTTTQTASGNSFETGAEVVRVGDDLILVKGNTPYYPDSVTPLDGLAEAAYQVFTAG